MRYPLTNAAGVNLAALGIKDAITEGGGKNPPLRLAVLHLVCLCLSVQRLLPPVWLMEGLARPGSESKIFEPALEDGSR